MLGVIDQRQKRHVEGGNREVGGKRETLESNADGMEAETTRAWGTDGRRDAWGAKERPRDSGDTHEGEQEEQETRGSGGTRGGHY